MIQTFTDPATGRQYTVDPATRATAWVEPDPPQTPDEPRGAQSQAYRPTPPRPRRKRRVFLWVFLAIQALFVIWLVGGISSAGGSPQDCGTLSADSCEAAQNVGTGIGIAFILIVWMVVDFLLAVIYGIYRLAKRT